MNLKSKNLLAVIALICLSHISIADDLPVGKTNHQVMSDFLHQQMIEYTTKNNIPNAVAAMVTADSIYLLQGYGYADLENRMPVDPRYHLFRTGSVSKIFTWTAIMQLYEQGLVDLDADISDYLDIEINQRILYEDNDSEPITLTHLMTHTAGYEDVLEGLFSFNPQPALKEKLLQKVPARIYPPGQVMAYSNWGTSLAGYMVENISGMRFEEYIKQHIFKPMGMDGSTFEQPLDAEFESRLVKACRWVDGEFHAGNFEHMPAPAGGLSTTAHDMALLLQAHLAGGSNAFGRILEKQTIEKMHLPLFKYHPLTAGMTYGLLETFVNGNRIVSHGGSSSIFDSGFYIIPGEGIGLFFAYSGGESFGHVNILYDFMSEFFPQKEMQDNQYKSLMEAGLDDLKGEYHQSRSMRTSSDRILNLLIGSLNLKPVGDTGLQFNLYGMDFSYRELMPGIYKTNKVNKNYPFGFMEYLFVTKAPDGRLMLVSDGPMTFIKARWYEGAMFSGLIFMVAVILAIGSLLFFGIRSIYKRFNKNSSSFKGVSLVGNRLAITHAIALLLTVIIFSLNSQPNIAHRLPNSFFNPNPTMDGLIQVGIWIVGIMGIILLASSVRVWLRGSETAVLKVYQSIYTLSALGVTWLLWFNNFLF
jgi:CubicO group peptidase (beta-lactamase class C family)